MEKSLPKPNNSLINDRSSEFLCLFCKKYLIDPLSCSECMDAHFCSKCVRDEFQKNPKCPSCQSNWTDKSIKKMPAFLKLYEREEVKCPNEGCSWSGNIPHFILHEEECDKKLIFCAFSKYGCSWSGTLCEEQVHGQSCVFKPFKRFFEIYETESEEIKNKFSKTQAELEELQKKHSKTEAELEELKMKNLKIEEELKTKVEKIEYELKDLINKTAAEASQNCSESVEELMKKCTDLKGEMNGQIEKCGKDFDNIASKIESDFKEGLRKTSTEAEQKTTKIENDLRKELKQFEEKQQKLLEKLNMSWDINEVEEKLKKLKESFPKLESTILNTAPNKHKLSYFLKELQIESFTLLFRASKDGYGAETFHKKCDNKGPTLVLIRTKNGYYFGAYAAADWESSLIFKATSSFLFSFNRESKHMVVQNNYWSMYCDKSIGPCFGYCDIFISSECNTNTSSYANLGVTYYTPYTHKSDEAKNYLAGSYNFSVEDYEVFAVKLK